MQTTKELISILPLSDGKCYKLDIENLIKYCITTQEDKAIQKDISELYKEGFDGLQLVQKQINETKIQNGNIKTPDSLRYDIVKLMVEIVTHMGIKQSENGGLHKYNSFDENSISETIAWNTLVTLGILVDVKTDTII